MPATFMPCVGIYTTESFKVFDIPPSCDEPAYFGDSCYLNWKHVQGKGAGARLSLRNVCLFLTKYLSFSTLAMTLHSTDAFLWKCE